MTVNCVTGTKALLTGVCVGVGVGVVSFFHKKGLKLPPQNFFYFIINNYK